MKLKRLLSALVVFTLVMTSVVCSVSAAGTYSAVTGYDVTTGKVSVTANIENAASGDYVSYIIYGDASITPVKDGEGNVTAADNDVISESNIVYIDQKTVDGNGTASFGTIDFDVDDIKNRHIKFATNGEDMTANISKSDNAIVYSSVDRVLERSYQVGLYKSGNGINSVSYSYLYNNEIIPGEVHNAASGKWDGNTARDDLEYFPVDAKAISFEFTRAGDAEGAIESIKFYNSLYTNNGNTHTSSTTSFPVAGIGNKMKLAINNGVMTDGTNSLTLTPGGMYQISGVAGEGGSVTPNGSNSVYMKIASAPIYTEFANSGENKNETWNAVTFLVSAGDASLPADCKGTGIDVYVYAKGTYEINTSAPESTSAGVSPLASYTDLTNLTGDNSKFGIQLIYSGNKSGEFSTDYFDGNYELVAVPYFIGADDTKHTLTALAGTEYYVDLGGDYELDVEE